MGCCWADKSARRGGFLRNHRSGHHLGSTQTHSGGFYLEDADLIYHGWGGFGPGSEVQQRHGEAGVALGLLGRRSGVVEIHGLTVSGG